MNVPESYITAINKLVGEDGLYPSRSELIRAATRNFLLKELSLAKNMEKLHELRKEPEIEKFDDKNYVRIPITKTNGDGEEVTEARTFKIVKELDEPCKKNNKKRKKEKLEKKTYKPKQLYNLFPYEFYFNLIISILNEHDNPIPSPELAGLMGLSPTSIYPHANALIKKAPGLVTKQKRSRNNGGGLLYSLDRDVLEEYLNGKEEPKPIVEFKTYKILREA